MRVKAKHDPYNHPDFRLTRGDVSPELTEHEARRIAADFPDNIEIVAEEPGGVPDAEGEDGDKARAMPGYPNRMVGPGMEKTRKGGLK